MCNWSRLFRTKWHSKKISLHAYFLPDIFRDNCNLSCNFDKLGGVTSTGCISLKMIVTNIREEEHFESFCVKYAFVSLKTKDYV